MPNALTILGIIPSILFFVFVLQGNYVLALIAFLGNAIDILDGALARSQNKVTAFGGFLDSTIDRISDALVISAFGFSNIVRWEIIIPLLITSFLISYTRSRGELGSNGKVSFKIGIIERPQRLIVIFIALVLYMFLPATIEWIFTVLTILSFITFLQRVLFAYKKL